MAAGQRMTENTGEKAEGREREAWWEIMTSGFWDVLLTHTTLQLPTPGAQAGLSSMSSRPTATSTVVCHVARLMHLVRRQSEALAPGRVLSSVAPFSDGLSVCYLLLLRNIDETRQTQTQTQNKKKQYSLCQSVKT